MSTFRFLEYPVYIRARELHKSITDLADSLSNRQLRDQLGRASLSIALNIAEGSAKKSSRDFARYIQVSLGSLNEVVACLDILQSSGLLEPKAYLTYENDCQEVARQLGGLMKKLYAK